MHESFTARCEPGSVVLMLSAVYGRMRLGRCIRGDYNVGCSTDVVAYFDAHCTGRQSCRVGVRNLIDIHPCQRDFTSYLEASYRCIRGYYYYYYYCPVRAPGFERIDQLRFLAGCRKRRLNQALSVLSLSLGFFLSVSVVLLTTPTFCIVLFLCVLFVGSVSWLLLLGCQYQCK